jgi:hypothetical protein
MSDRVEEQAYRWQRRSMFAITIAVVIALLVLCVLLA